MTRSCEARRLQSLSSPSFRLRDSGATNEMGVANIHTTRLKGHFLTMIERLSPE